MDPDTAAPMDAVDGRQRQVLFARVQALDRPVRRQARVLPRLLRQAHQGRHRLQSPHPQARAHQPPDPDPGGQARGHRHHVTPATSPPSSASRTSPPVTRSATKITTILLEPPSFPEPVISMAVEPKTKVDQEKMGIALQRLAEEDPTFRVHTDEETGQTIIAGMGELHLEIIRDRMLREFKVEANAGKPQIAYRETITAGSRRRRQVHQAVRRSRPIRPRHRQGPPGRARQGPRSSRTRSSAARFPKEYIPACQEGHRRSGAQRRRRRLPGHRCRSRHHRRLATTKSTRTNSRSRWRRSSRSRTRFKKAKRHPPRADHGGRGHHPGRIPGRHHGRPQPPPRQDQGHRSQEQPVHHQRRRAAGRNVRLRHRHPLAVEGPLHLLDGAVALRAGAGAGPRRRARPEGPS